MRTFAPATVVASAPLGAWVERIDDMPRAGCLLWVSRLGGLQADYQLLNKDKQRHELTKISKAVAVAAALFLGGSAANAQLNTDKKYVFTGAHFTFKPRPKYKKGFQLNYDKTLQLTEILILLPTKDYEDVMVGARHKVQTDGKGRVKQIDMYFAPQGVSEPVEPYPLMTRIVYSYDAQGNPTLRETFDMTSPNQDRAAAKVEADKKGRIVKISGEQGSLITWDYNEKDQLVKYRPYIPSAKPEGGYETYEYDAKGNMVRQNWFYKDANAKADKYQEMTYTEDGKIASRQLFLLKEDKTSYSARKKVTVHVDPVEKTEDVYYPNFFIPYEDPYQFLPLPIYFNRPGHRVVEDYYDERESIMYTYELSAKIVGNDPVLLQEYATLKAFKSGGALAVEGLDIVKVEVIDMAGKSVFQTTGRGDRWDIPAGSFASGLYVVKATDKDGKVQTAKVAL